MKKKGTKRRGIGFLLLVAVLLAVILLVVANLEDYLLQLTAMPTESQPTSVATVPVRTDPPTEAVTEPTAPAERRIVNMLLVGQDRREDEGRGRSDSMILCNFDTGTKTLTMVSFLRDIYLEIPGRSSNRLNAAYSWGGIDLLNKTLEQNFGVQTDVQIEIDFSGFQTMIDYLGGVDIELTADEAEYINNSRGTALTAGVNHLDGDLALVYSRIRYLDSDFGRTARQRNVLTALLEQFGDASFQSMLNALDVFLLESESNLSDDALLSLMLELYTMLRDCTVASHQIPADGTYSYQTIKGMSIIKVDLEANTRLLEEWLPYADDISAAN